jgi:CRISPR/Cas system-associated exonuclease Cas4 (RecB family)
MESIMELRKKPHISFSQLSTYLSCSLKWAFRYHFKIEEESESVPLLFGSSFHSAAEDIANARKNNKAMTLNEARKLFSLYWNIECKAAYKLAFKDNEEFEKLNSLGMDMIECLYSNFGNEDILGVAVPFEISIPGVDKSFIGEYDLIIRNDEKRVIIVDWKTARSWAKNKEDTDLQATAYAYSYYLKHGVIPEVQFHVYKKTKVPAFEIYSAYRNTDDFAKI